MSSFARVFARKTFSSYCTIYGLQVDAFRAKYGCVDGVNHSVGAHNRSKTKKTNGKEIIEIRSEKSSSEEESSREEEEVSGSRFASPLFVAASVANEERRRYLE